MVFVIKRLISTKFRVLLKGKKKTGGSGGLGRATAHFGSSVAIEKFCRDKVSPTLCRDRVFYVAIGFPMSQPGPRSRTRHRLGTRSGRACAKGRVRNSSPVRMRDSSPMRDRSPTRVRDSSPTRVRDSNPTRVRDSSPTRVRDSSPTRVTEPPCSMSRHSLPGPQHKHAG